MSALPTLTLCEPTAAPSLCRAGGKTCAACCYGEKVPHATLHARIQRQTRLFAVLVEARRASRWRFLVFEVVVRRGIDLILAIVLCMPWLGNWLRSNLRPRMSCAFLAYEDPAESRVGCLLHPSRWHGRDMRQEAAFALLPGFGCGSTDYFCLSAWRHAHAPWQEQRDLLRKTQALDWFAYGQAVRDGSSSRKSEPRP
jgi:hypothetical protein